MALFIIFKLYIYIYIGNIKLNEKKEEKMSEEAFNLVKFEREKDKLIREYKKGLEYFKQGMEKRDIEFTKIKNNYMNISELSKNLESLDEHLAELKDKWKSVEGGYPITMAYRTSREEERRKGSGESSRREMRGPHKYQPLIERVSTKAPKASKPPRELGVYISQLEKDLSEIYGTFNERAQNSLRIAVPHYEETLLFVGNLGENYEECLLSLQALALNMHTHTQRHPTPSSIDHMEGETQTVQGLLMKNQELEAEYNELLEQLRGTNEKFLTCKFERLHLEEELECLGKKYDFMSSEKERRPNLLVTDGGGISHYVPGGRSTEENMGGSQFRDTMDMRRVATDPDEVIRVATDPDEVIRVATDPDEVIPEEHYHHHQSRTSSLDPHYDPYLSGVNRSRQYPSPHGRILRLPKREFSSSPGRDVYFRPTLLHNYDYQTVIANETPKKIGSIVRKHRGGESFLSSENDPLLLTPQKRYDRVNANEKLASASPDRRNRGILSATPSQYEIAKLELMNAELRSKRAQLMALVNKLKRKQKQRQNSISRHQQTEYIYIYI